MSFLPLRPYRTEISAAPATISVVKIITKPDDILFSTGTTAKQR